MSAVFPLHLQNFMANIMQDFACLRPPTIEDNKSLQEGMPGINENFQVAIKGTFTKPNSVISVKQ
jgi:hypothetical protein